MKRLQSHLIPAFNWSDICFPKYPRLTSPMNIVPSGYFTNVSPIAALKCPIDISVRRISSSSGTSSNVTILLSVWSEYSEVVVNLSNSVLFQNKTNVSSTLNLCWHLMSRRGARPISWHLYKFLAWKCGVQYVATFCAVWYANMVSKNAKDADGKRISSAVFLFFFRMEFNLIHLSFLFGPTMYVIAILYWRR